MDCSDRCTWRKWWLVCGAVLCLLLGVSPERAEAGGGPENVLLVVNANSHDSKTIANHWIRFRGIPSTNVVYLDWKRLHNNCSGEKFLEGILEPIIGAIARRKLDAQIDYIVYSSDFPWRIDLRDIAPDERGKPARPIASLTGATYLWRILQAESQAVASLASNHYGLGGNHEGVGEYYPTRAFRSRYQWSPQGERIDEGGPQYVLSTMLAVTTGRGNTVDEAVRYLRRAAVVDATHPYGTVYFARNSNVRSKTRHDRYDEAALELRKLGRPAEVIERVLPERKPDVIGLMAGAAKLDLASAGNVFLPGAIAEHLTSYGGVMRKNASHTPLSEFLRHGAAGASGTVFEPFALQQKFPRPDLHVHYARGASLAEAFYQSVSGPFQLLIVGDPLCQPFAIRPRVEVGGVTAGDVVRGTVPLKLDAFLPAGRELARYEVYVDGQLIALVEPDRDYELDTTQLPDGYHEIRVVAIEGGPLEFQGRLAVPVWVDNYGGRIDLEMEPQTSVRRDSILRVRAASPGATAILILQNHRTVGRIDGAEGTIEIEAESLGDGPVSLRAVAMAQQAVVARPVSIYVGEDATSIP